MTFKMFMEGQVEDVSAEEFQRRFQSYQRTYIRDFSDIFFDITKAESWFQDRYNPLNVLRCEQSAAEWSRGESGRIRDELLRDPTVAIEYMSLDKRRAANLGTQPPEGISGEHTNKHCL